jgi:transposase InsO family protein
LSPNDRVVVAIDYFSRKIWAKVLRSKESGKVLKFVKSVYDEIPFRKLITDNGKEFSNKEMEKWTKSKGILHKHSVPYYHQSNGRIERVNRTIRNAFRKTPGPIRKN